MALEYFEQAVGEVKEVFLTTIRNHPSIRSKKEEEKFPERPVEWRKEGQFIGWELVNPHFSHTFPDESTDENDGYIGNNTSKVAEGNLNFRYSLELRGGVLNSAWFRAVTTARPYFNPHYSKEWRKRNRYCDDLEKLLAEGIIEIVRSKDERVNIDDDLDGYIARPSSEINPVYVFQSDHRYFYGFAYDVSVCRGAFEEEIQKFLAQKEDMIKHGIDILVGTTIDYLFWRKRYFRDHLSGYLPACAKYREQLDNLHKKHDSRLQAFFDRASAEFSEIGKGDKK